MYEHMVSHWPACEIVIRISDQKRELEYLNSDSIDVQNAFDVLGKAIGSKRGKEGSVELLKECGSLPPVSEAPVTLEGAEEGSPELPEKSGDEGQTA